MLLKNEIYEAVVTDYTPEGQGVARIEGCAVFIPNAIAGERYAVRIERWARPGRPVKSWRFWKSLPTG